MAQPVARYLADIAGVGSGRLPLPTDRISPEAHRNDVMAAAAEAYGKGMADARAAAEAELAMMITDERRAAAKAFDDQRKQWTEVEAARIAESLRGAIKELESELAKSVARLMEPFVSSLVHRQACDEFVTIIGDLVSRSKGTSIELTGPRDLVQTVQSKLGGDVVVKHAGEGPAEVRAVVDQTLVETRVEAWLARVKEAME